MLTSWSIGLTVIAGHLLLQSPEEDAFWTFVSLMDTHLKRAVDILQLFFWKVSPPEFYREMPTTTCGTDSSTTAQAVTARLREGEFPLWERCLVQ